MPLRFIQTVRLGFSVGQLVAIYALLQQYFCEEKW